MYELTNETVAGRKYYARLELDNGTVLTNYGDDAVGITSISISSTLCGSESVSIGCVNAACVTIVLEAGTALENQRFTLYLGQEFDGAVEWVPMGIFTGTKAEVSEDKLTVEAWDDLYFAGGDYTPDSSVTGTCAFYEALADVCDKLEWGFHGNVTAQTVNGIDVSDLTVAGMPTGLTYAAAIGHLAALCGANACMDRDGCLVFRQFAESGQVLGTDDCYSGGMVFKTSDFTVASLTNTLETETTGDDGETTTETTEVERTTGAAGGSIALTNPIMTEDNIDTAWDVVKGFAYRPATLTAVGQLAVDVGDVLRVPTLTGGRNYLTGTRDFDSGTWAYSSNVTLAADDEGYTVATFAATDAAAWNGVFSRLSPLLFSAVRGQTVTLSFEVRSDDFETLNVLTNRGLVAVFALCTGSSISRTLYHRVNCYATEVLSDSWQRVSVTAALTDDYFSSGSGDIDEDTRFYIQIYDYSVYSMQVRKVKLEIGDTATNWTPTPEDDDESIYLVPVMTHTLEYDGGLKSTITAAGESESQQSAAVSGPVAQQIKELTTKVADTKVLASGKNAVYYAAAAPSADDYTLSVNDLWFDTSGGDYAMYYWDGDKWVAAPFGTSALGDGIITTAKLVAGAVTAEKLNVSELSAITANLGTVTAGDITGTTFTTTGALGYTKLSGGTVTSLGNTVVMAEIPDFEGDGSPLEVTGQPYFDMDGGNIDLYAYETALRASQLGGLHLTATGIYGYPGTLDDSDGPWFHLYNPSKAVTINGTLDVTGETTVNNFRVPEVQHGYVDVTPSAAGERTSVEVTFDTAFSGTPTVTATVQTSVPDNRAVGVLSISTTGFTVYVYSSGSGTVRVHWIAVY